jgi:hypothetical protein
MLAVSIGLSNQASKLYLQNCSLVLNKKKPYLLPFPSLTTTMKKIKSRREMHNFFIVEELLKVVHTLTPCCG